MSRLSHNVYFASLSIHTQSIHARVYVDIYRVVRKVISSSRTSYSSQLRSKLFLSSELQLIYIQEKFVLLPKKEQLSKLAPHFWPVDNSRKDSNFSNSSDRAKRLDVSLHEKRKLLSQRQKRRKKDIRARAREEYISRELEGSRNGGTTRGLLRPRPVHG